MRRCFTPAVLALFGCLLLPSYVAAGPCSGPACCVVYGEPAVCRSPVVEARAKAIVMRRCPRCDAGAVTDWIFSYQMNRGPYERAPDLAGDVLQALRGRSAKPPRG